VKFDISKVELGPLSKQIFEVLQSAGSGGPQFGYNIDVLAPPAFNDEMQNGFQAILAGKKTPEQEAADLQAAWEKGMPAAGATPTG
jgi:raffinose/stachyose/melibiose transport system substrate-binding protein